MTIKLHQRTHPSRASTPPPPRNFTSQIQNSLRLTVKPSIFQEHRVPETSPFSRTPNFLSSPFFSSLSPPSLSSQLAALYNGRKGNAIGRAGRVNVSSVSDVFRAFVSSISRFVRDRLKISNRGLVAPLPPVARGTRFSCKFWRCLYSNSGFFSPRSGYQFLTTFRPI